MMDISTQYDHYESVLLDADADYHAWLDELCLDRAALATAWLDHVNVTGDLAHHEDEFWNEVPY